MGKFELGGSHRSLHILQTEQLRRLRYELYRRNPFAWLKDVMGEDVTVCKWTDFGEAYTTHVWDGDVDPLYRAWMDVADDSHSDGQPKKWVGIKAATGTSKTWWLSRLILWYLDVHDNCMVITTAPKESQLTMNVWSELGRVIDRFKVVRPWSRLTKLSLKPEGNNPYDHLCTTQQSHIAFGFVIGVGSEEQSATKAQGFHRDRMLIVCEETPGMKAAVMTALQNTSTGTYNTMVAVGNPDGEMDELEQFCQLSRVSSYRISAYDYPNVVLKAEVIPGAVTQGSIDFRKDKYGEDSPLYLSRVRGITPAEGDDNLIKKLWVEQCIYGTERWIDGAIPEVGDTQAAGIDVANSETGDKGAIVHARGNVLYDFKEFQCSNANAIAHNLMLDNEVLIERGLPVYGLNKAAEIELYPSFIGVDAVGLGISTINTFLEYGWTVQALHGGQWDEVIPVEEFVDILGEVKIKPLYKFANLRSQMMWELREDFRNGKIILHLVTPALIKQVIKELCAAKFMLNGGAIAIEDKRLIKKRLGGKSPNLADAIAYANWARKGYRASMFAGSLPMSGGA